MNNKYKEAFEQVKFSEEMKMEVFKKMMNSKHEKTSPKKTYLKPIAIALCTAIILWGGFASVNLLSHKPVDEVAMPNPITDVTSLEEANALTGYSAQEPGVFPFDINSTTIVVINKSITSILYKENDMVYMQYRTAQGEEGISGDYTAYSASKTVDWNGNQILLQGARDGEYQLVTWANKSFNYSLNFWKGLSEQQIMSIVESVH